jgi:hypothetical protein
MQSHLTSKDLDDLLALDVINEDFRKQSEQISIRILSHAQNSSLLSIYEEKKKLLLENLKSERLNNEKNLFKEKLVSVFKKKIFLI